MAATGSSVFKNFEAGDIVSGRSQTVSFGLWADGAISQSAFYTSSIQISNSGSSLSVGNGSYYWDIYNQALPDTNAQSQKYFAIAHGNFYGSGSYYAGVTDALVYPARAIYNQYKNLLLLPSDTKFSFKTGSGDEFVDSDDIYVINFATDKYKDRVDAGQWSIKLQGSASFVTLTDDSAYPATVRGTSTSVYNVVGSTPSGTYDGLGLFYPSLGTIVLNPSKVAARIGSEFLPYTSNVSVTTKADTNFQKIFNAVATGSNVTVRASEFVPSRHYFVRVKNSEFNYSNNPSFVTGSEGALRFDSFSNDPQVYLTTVGLYDDNNDLVAVAKLSQPLLKTFDNEALIRIRLTF
jgi:hypothetical protein